MPYDGSTGSHVSDDSRLSSIVGGSRYELVARRYRPSHGIDGVGVSTEGGQ